MSINLIYPGRDTAPLVKDLSDNWVISGPIRACIHLSNVWHLREPKSLTIEPNVSGRGGPSFILNGSPIFGPNDLNHSWAEWANRNDANYSWLVFFAQDMCEEHIRRWPHLKGHGIVKMLEALENMPESLAEGAWTEPWFAKDAEFES